MLNTKSTYEIEEDFSPTSSPISPQYQTCAHQEDRKNRNTLKNPKQVELYNAVLSGEVERVNQILYSGIDVKLGAEENRPFTKLLLRAAIENDHDEVLEVNKS